MKNSSIIKHFGVTRTISICMTNTNRFIDQAFNMCILFIDKIMMWIGVSKPCTYIFYTAKNVIIWAASSEFVSSSIPSWQILTAHAQPFRGARDLAFCLKVPLDSLLVWASSEGSGETARMRRLAWTFAARIGDKYQIRLTRSIFKSSSIVFIYLISVSTYDW